LSPRLFDKKGGIYSSRPDNYIANTLLCPNSVHILLVPYSSGWRKLRKCVQQLLSVTAVDKLLVLQAAEASQTLHDLIQAPEDYYDHLRRYSTSVILATVFGQRGAKFTSQKVQDLYHVQNRFTEMIEPGATPPVDAFPILKYLPEFMAPWKTKAKAIRHEQRELYFTLLEETKKKMAGGDAGNCFLASLIAEQEKNGFNDEEIAYIGGILVRAKLLLILAHV
jgi:cytochrome P450